jgi:hypothetical protein
MGNPEGRAVVMEHLSEQEQKIVGFVQSHGCFINAIFDPDGIKPNFAYSIGFPASLGQPDILLSGLDLGLMRALINDVYALCRNGLCMADFARSAEIMSDYDCVFRQVAPENLVAEFWNSAIWFQETYRGEMFESAFQVVWPDDGGKFPWEPGFDDNTGGGQLKLWEGGAVH